MANITTEVAYPTYNNHLKQMADYPMTASLKIFAGGLVCVDPATGRAVKAADTATYVFVGIAVRTCDNSAGAADALRVTVAWGHEIEIASSAITAADIGAQAVVGADDQTITDAGAGTNDVPVGRITNYLGSNVARVRLQNGLGQ